jgi:hypothetical protein
VPAKRISLDDALDLTRTGDVWLFRGHKLADRAVRVTTNSPVNHVGISVVIDDLPPLMWHAELGKSLPDMWSGTRHRGAQLHDLREAVTVWVTKYSQQAWLRQLEPPATREMEDAVLRAVARLDGTPFPSTARLASGWVRGRVPAVSVPRIRVPAVRVPGIRVPGIRVPAIRHRARPGASEGAPASAQDRALETAYCAEIAALTYQAMGLLPGGRHRPNWYDPGRFWSGDDLALTNGARLGGEIAVDVPH